MLICRCDIKYTRHRKTHAFCCAGIAGSCDSICVQNFRAQQLQGEEIQLSVGRTPVAPHQQPARGHAKQCFSAFSMLLMMLGNETRVLMNAHQTDKIARTQFSSRKREERFTCGQPAVRWDTRKCICKVNSIRTRKERNMHRCMLPGNRGVGPVKKHD